MSWSPLWITQRTAEISVEHDSLASKFREGFHPHELCWIKFRSDICNEKNAAGQSPIIEDRIAKVVDYVR